MNNVIHAVFRWPLVRVAGTSLLLLGSAGAFAQGILIPTAVLRSGGTLSSTQLIGTFSTNGPAFFQFAFGFSTDEEPAPGLFLDSLTLTIGDANGLLSAIYNVTDRTGAYWAPESPGSIFIPSNSVVRQVIPFPTIEPNHAHQFAYSVTVPIPTELLGRDLNFYADLFDNQNGIGSLGWISITPVPEPATWALALTGLAIFFAIKRRK